MAVKIALMGHPRSLHTLFARLGAGYRLKGFVPWASHGKVSFGACKKEGRGDYIMGISGSGAGRPRRVLLWMPVIQR